MKLLPFKIASFHTPLFAFLSLFGVIINSSATTTTDTPFTPVLTSTEMTAALTTLPTLPSTTKSPPENVKGVTVTNQSETTITLMWSKVNNISNYILTYNNGSHVEVPIDEPQGGSVEYQVSSLTAGTKYNFTLFTVFNEVKSSGYTFHAVTAPENVKGVAVTNQSETTINLMWGKVNNISKYILIYNNGSPVEVPIDEPQGGSVEYQVSSLTAGTKYNFTLFSVFDEVNSSGYTFHAVTVPLNPTEFKTVTQNETSVTLQWKKVDDIINYILVFSEEEINVSASAQDEVTKVISNLTNMTKYDFTLFTVFENIRSSGVNHTAFTAPPNVEEVKTVTQDETSITLQWKKVNGIIEYRLKFTGREIHVNASAENVSHTISGLTSGRKYNFNLFAVFENITSEGVNHTAVTAPRNSGEIESVSQNETSITLQWGKVDEILDYKLELNGKPIDVRASEGQKRVTHAILGLMSGTEYNFSLFAVFASIQSSGVNFTAATVPSTVTSVSVTERDVTSVSLKWNVDLDKEWSYFLQINGETLPLQPNESSSVLSHSVSSLQPGTEYPFSVITTFFGLNSTAYESFIVTAIDCASGNWHVTNMSIHGMVTGLFTNATATYKSNTEVSNGGSNVSFTGLYPGATYNVSLVYEKNSQTFLQCQHRVTIIPPLLNAHCEYWAAGYSVYITWKETEGVWTAVEVNVTGETHKELNDGNQHIIITGFQPATTYEVSLTSLSGNERRSEPYVFSCSTDPRGVIAGSICAVLIFGILVLLVFIFLKRSEIIRRNKSLIGGSKLSNKNQLNAISAADFPHHFYKLSGDENMGFSQEYENLHPVGREQTQKVALLPENKPKNRFTNILPYDWCRVKLSASSPDDTSDYINANYIPGYKNNREYIATQGPLPSTVNDFWRMIWEQRVEGIVMVTNCVEGGRAKCERYWPTASKPCFYGELIVKTTSEQEEPDWTLRAFTIKHNNGSEERKVEHFHFTAWPDHGVPQNTKVLIQFRGLVRQHMQKTGVASPTVVHCSAGVGRTGTIIALDVLLQQLDREKAVGINAFVHKMRLNRTNMVQTESQYIFLHQCIMDCLQPYEKNDDVYENEDVIYMNATALKEFHSHT